MAARADRAHALGILGLPQDAGHDEIVRAYRRLSKTTHPDATGRADREADRRFAAITDAYRRLAEDLPGGTTTEPGTPESGPVVVPGARPADPLIVAGPASVTTTPLAPLVRDVPLVAGPATFSPAADSGAVPRRRR